MLVDGIELVRQSTGRFTRAQEKKAAGHETEVEERQDAFLRGRFEIDEEVPARDQMHFRERSIFRNVVRSENDQLPEILRNLISICLAPEEPFAAFLVDVLEL